MDSLSLPRLRWIAPVLLCAAVLVAGCDDEELLPPETEAPLFERYAALGNSITAGFQSGGISASTQQESYAALLAASMDTEFNQPLLNDPGCPPPIVDALTGERAANVDCALRTTPLPPVIHNVAVPGAQVIDLLTNLDSNSSANTLTTFILGGRTQLEAAADVQPTFATVWIGNNDVLGAALSGNTDLITAAGDFETRYRQAMDSLATPDLEGALLIGVANPTLIPHLSPGAAYAQAQPTIQALLDGSDTGGQFVVADNCAAGGATSLVPYGYGFGTLLAQAQNGLSVQLDCLNDPPVLTPEETATVVGAVQQFNAIIQAEAQERGWAYLDPNPVLQEQQDQVPVFPDLENQPAIFGPFFSLDGVHPNGAAHVLVANAAVDAINAQYGTDLPPIATTQ
ncbi:MAG: SGNH/GDSL hydrolase family protein [Bacteroidetes bacterium]|jgi:lysophospholipase L1-like esterase|nr:SGNH/GDSL hydrolase family protein [Bacteroidota bacterium]